MSITNGSFDACQQPAAHPPVINYSNLNTTIMRRVSYTNQPGILCIPWKHKIHFYLPVTFLIGIALLFTFSSKAQVAPVSPPIGGFAIDGGLRAGTPTSGVGDWYPGTSGGSVFDASGAVINSATSGRAIPDAYTSNDNIFTNGSKFNDYIGDLHWFTNSAPDKNDINNALYHISRDAANSQWAFMAGDRLSTNGTSYIDFEFLQGTVVVNSNGTFTGTPKAGKAGGGGRTENDMIISMEYTNGGSKPLVYVYQWKKIGSTWSYQPATIPDLNSNAFAETNRTGAETNLPYLAFGNTSYQQYAFVEAAVNITYLLNQLSGGSACAGLSIKTLWVKTKASASSTAALKDFVDPISVNFDFGSSEITNPGPFCSNDNNVYTLTATPPGGTFTVDGITNVTSFTPSIAGAGDHAIAYSFSGCSATATFKVIQTPTVNDPADQVKCVGENTNTVTFGGNAATSYTWTNDNTSIGLAASGSGDIASFKTTNTTSAAITATITVTPHNVTTDKTCDGTPQTFTITVNPIPTVTKPSDQVKCKGEASDAINFSGSAATSYSWTNDNTAIGLGASGTGNIASFTTANGGSTALVANITVTPYFTGSGKACPGDPQTFTITVNPTPTVNDPADQVKCAGESSNAVIFGGSGATSYTWTNSNTAIGLSAASGTGNIDAFTTSNTTGAAISSTITVTPHFTGGGKTCDGTPQSFIITVNPTPTVNDPSDQVKCKGEASDAITFSGSGSTSYTWTNDNIAIGLGASGTGNISSFTTANSGSTALVANITVTPHFTGSGRTCDGSPQSFTITVNPTPTVNDPADQVKCAGANSNAVTFGGSGATSYTWTNSNIAIGLGASGTGNISAFQTTNSTSAVISGTITVTPHFTGSGKTCDGTPQSFTITVNPTPTVADPSDQVKCKGANSNAVNFSGTATSFTWTNDNTAIGLGASGTGNIPAFVTTNSTAAAITGTITVTPHFTGGGQTCDGTPQSFTITVNPTPTVNDPADQTICASSSTTAVSFSGAVNGTLYSWTNNNTTIGLAASGTGDIPAFNGINTGNTAAVATITVTPSANGCTGTPQSFTITVNNVPAAPTICIIQPSLCGPAKGSIKVTAPLVSGYQYSKDNGATWQDCNVFLNVDAGSNPVVKYKTSATATGCVSNSSTCSNATICSEQPVACTPGNFSLKLAPKTEQVTETSTLKVSAYPNPFSDKINFVVSSPVSGKGSLEVYNSLGQKIKTIYQGNINKGNQNFELRLPQRQVSNLIYVLNVDGQKVSGKILQVNQ